MDSTITSTGAGSSASQSSSPTNVANKPLDKDAFLKLLVTQLQNQDPMAPMEDKEFIAQLAQFSGVEQMTQVNTNLESLAASQDNLAALLQGQSSYASVGLIGKTVKWVDQKTQVQTSGKVDSIQFTGGIPTLKIGDKQVQVSDVISVS